ncbi:MAG: NAD(P)H-dependent oxidoreductase subunit E [Clostridia bacterium]|jgi:NADH:ubiquinone oxidoreductase subunit E|nr:NAD(P)H-dependent oxidoreductase subunit E [Clostridia bacterium]
MIIIQVCVGSSCHLKGSEELVGLLQDKIKENALEDEIVLVGSFCTGKCNRTGVTLMVDDDVYPGITRETFAEFWRNTILPAVEKKRG